jgi:hypothetical protein
MQGHSRPIISTKHAHHLGSRCLVIRSRSVTHRHKPASEKPMVGRDSTSPAYFTPSLASATSSYLSSSSSERLDARREHGLDLRSQVTSHYIHDRCRTAPRLVGTSMVLVPPTHDSAPAGRVKWTRAAAGLRGDVSCGLELSDDKTASGASIVRVSLPRLGQWVRQGSG